MQNSIPGPGRPSFQNPGATMRFNAPNYPRPGFNPNNQGSPGNVPGNNVMMGPRPNLASAPPNAYVGSPLRPGGPGMNQSMGPMKRQSDSRVSNQPGKM